MPTDGPKKAPRRISSAAALDLPQLNITAPLDYSIIPSTFQNLICGQGEVDGNPVLSPYINFRLNRSVNLKAQTIEELEVAESFSGSIAYENMAFLIMDLSRDFRTSISRLSVFSSGDLKPEPARLRYSAHCMKLARDALDEAINELETIAASSPSYEPKAARKPLRRAAVKRPTK